MKNGQWTLGQNKPNQTQFYLAEAPVLRSFSGGGLAKADKPNSQKSQNEIKLLFNKGL